MRGLRHGACLAVLLVAATAAHADPPSVDIPATVPAPATGYLTLRPKTDAASISYVSPGLDPFPGELLTDKTAFVVPVRGLTPGTYPCWAVAASKTGEQRVIPFAVVVAGGPTPPQPPGPGPTPDPAPGPVTSFHVVLIYESRDTLTADQTAVVYGEAVAKWLDANCTTGPLGWRRRDKDAPGENDPTFAALWAAVKPKVTATPCVAIEVNGKVTLEPLPGSPDLMVALLTKYRGK